MADAPKKDEKPAPAPATPKPNLISKLKGFFPGKKKSAAKGTSGDIFTSLRSSDRPTRLVTLLHYASILGIIVTAVWTVQGIIGILRDPALFQKQESEQGQALNKFFKDQRETGYSREVTLPLGSFQIEILQVEDPANPSKSTRRPAMNMADVDIVVECETIPTCRFMETNLSKVRDQIFAGTQAVERKELLTPEGKRRFKDLIKGRINEWLQVINQGKIRKVFITKLVVT